MEALSAVEIGSGVLAVKNFALDSGNIRVMGDFLDLRWKVGA
jgi:hypothetical protein